MFSALWFYFPGEYVLIANRDLSLFIKSPDYLISTLKSPGGLLEYLGCFLSQFFRYRLAGSLVLAGVITAGYYVSLELISRPGNKKKGYIGGVLTAIFLVGMHNYYLHQISYTLGFILAMALVTVSPTTNSRRRVFLALAVPLFYLAGGGYVWFYCGLMLAEEVVRSRRIDYIAALLGIVYPVLIILCGSILLYLEPLKDLVLMHLPAGEAYGKSPWPLLFTGWTFLMMFLAVLPDPGRRLKLQWYRMIQIATCLLAVVLILKFSYHKKNSELFRIEKLAVEEDWEGLLSYAAEHPSRNLFGSFYTNLALANKGMLCTRLFEYPQSFGRSGLCFGWDAKGEILKRGSDFFWAVQFVNEAHHWAYESMIVNGFTRRNLVRLIQTELVRENYKVAEKYIEYLGKALFQRETARYYEGFLYQRKAMEEDPELGPRLRLHVEQDFFPDGSDLEKNLLALLANEPSNRVALDYLMALYLLEKGVDKIADFLPDYIHAYPGGLPPLLEESLLVHQITHREGKQINIRISQNTISRFDEYTRTLRLYRNPQDAARAMFPVYGNTFWFHFNFSQNPNN
jgi:hypothetical protein